MVLSIVTVDFWAPGSQSGVVQNEFLQTWSCYISSESIFDTDFLIYLAQFNFWAQGGGQVGVT